MTLMSTTAVKSAYLLAAHLYIKSQYRNRKELHLQFWVQNYGHHTGKIYSNQESSLVNTNLKAG